MKIGIVTLIGEFNYGNLLQSYALQIVLERMGHNVVIFNRRIPKISTKLQIFRIMSFIKSLFLRYLKGHNEILIVNPFVENYNTRDRIDSSELNIFIKKYIKRSLALRSISDMMKFSQKEQFDAYVVGSDQVWREEYTHSIEEMFLSFLPKTSNAIRIAYAASFGTNANPISINNLSVCSELLKRFNAVSVREKSAVELCNNLFGREAVHVLDPTMLLTIDDYKTIFERTNTPESKGKLLTYILDEKEELNVVITRIAQMLKMLPFSINTLEKVDSISYVYRRPSVEAWLRGFCDAEFVITDSYHACVFSILFNKPFICLGNKKRGNTRFESLLGMFGLQDRIVDESNIFNVCLKKIDWVIVNDILNHMRSMSKNFLERELYAKKES